MSTIPDYDDRWPPDGATFREFWALAGQRWVPIVRMSRVKARQGIEAIHHQPPTLVFGLGEGAEHLPRPPFLQVSE